MPMTITDLAILLHYHCCAESYPNVTALACQSSVHKWVELGMLEALSEPRPNVFKTTERAKALIEHILKTPMPEQNWLVPPQEGSTD